MAQLYTRHSKNCKKTNKHFHKCGCPLWIYDPNLPRDQQRYSAGTNDYDEALKLASDATRSPQPVKPSKITVEEAITRYLTKRSGKKNDPNAAPYKDRYMLRDGSANQPSLLQWSKKQGFIFLKDILGGALDSWRCQWIFRDSSYSLKIHNAVVKRFFKDAVTFDYLTKNPYDKLDSISVQHVPTLPLSPEEYQRMLNSVDACAEKDRKCMLTFMLLMRWSGLAIIDASTLERSRLGKDDRLRTYRQKTNEWVYVLLPHFVAETLRTQGNLNPNYFFWNPSKRTKTSQVHWFEDRLRKIYEQAGIPATRTTDSDAVVCNRGAHRFRDTFAVEFLKTGGRMQDLSKLLGHSKIATTEAHYSPWDTAQQAVLDEAMERALVAQGVYPAVPALANHAIQ
jgi:integrase